MAHLYIRGLVFRNEASAAVCEFQGYRCAALHPTKTVYDLMIGPHDAACTKKVTRTLHCNFILTTYSYCAVPCGSLKEEMEEPNK
jgi:hypothetical protein